MDIVIPLSNIHYLISFLPFINSPSSLFRLWRRCTLFWCSLLMLLCSLQTNYPVPSPVSSLEVYHIKYFSQHDHFYFSYSLIPNPSSYFVPVSLLLLQPCH